MRDRTKELQIIRRRNQIKRSLGKNWKRLPWKWSKIPSWFNRKIICCKNSRRNEGA